ncbi:hypothetical protein ACROYT_G013169 [Oculina patagonica]
MHEYKNGGNKDYATIQNCSVGKGCFSIHIQRYKRLKLVKEKLVKDSLTMRAQLLLLLTFAAFHTVTLSLSNWKQCVWRASDGRDFGLIKHCTFQKSQEKTALRVFYSGSLRILGCTTCCKRWFFTFNGVECSGPMPIDGIVYMHGVSGLEPLRVRHIEGYCENIPKGQVHVGFNVGNCAGYGNADAHSGWNAVSRIVVEEVPAPKP